MTKSWQASLVILAAAGIQMQSAHAADISTPPSVEMQGLSDVDVAIGRGDTPQATSFGLKLFTQPLPGSAERDDFGSGERASVRREASFLDEVDDGTLIDVVAAVRSDPDQPTERDDAGEAVDTWTDMLDEGGSPSALTPPRVKQAPRDAAGRSPSGMGSQIIP